LGSGLKALDARRKEFDDKRKLYKESQRLKKAIRKRKLKAFDARRNKFDAKQVEFKSKKKARKAGQEAAKEQSAKALEIKKLAQANGPSQEELAQIRREAKNNRKKHKRAATGAKKQLLANQVSRATRYQHK
jgi:hypothetical protein